MLTETSVILVELSSQSGSKTWIFCCIRYVTINHFTGETSMSVIHRYPDTFVHLTPNFLSKSSYQIFLKYLKRFMKDDYPFVTNLLLQHHVCCLIHRILIVLYTQMHNTDQQLCTHGNPHWHTLSTFKSHLLIY